MAAQTHLTESVKTLLTFSGKNGDYIAHTQLPFKPAGLMIWTDHDPSDCYVDVFVGVNSVQCSVPLRWYSTLQSFEQVKQAWFKGQDIANWQDWPSIGIGNVVRVSFSNGERKPLYVEAQMLVWGENLCI